MLANVRRSAFVFPDLAAREFEGRFSTCLFRSVEVPLAAPAASRASCSPAQHAGCSLDSSDIPHSNVVQPFGLRAQQAAPLPEMTCTLVFSAPEGLASTANRPTTRHLTPRPNRDRCRTHTEARCAAASAANISSTGASLPVTSSNPTAPWKTSIDIPPAGVAPARSVSNKNGVIGGA